MLVTETFHGYIETTQDVLLIFEGCRRGLLPRICRRLQERERKMIRSGSIFVFDERESGIKRWTDGRVWSPSRILGNFLIYRELDKKPSNNEKRLSLQNNNNNNYQQNYYGDSSRRSFSSDTIDRNKERQLVGSLSDSYKFREDGLIKKTMSIIVNGVAQHLISYYDPKEVIQEKLRAPSSVPELASLEISPELLVKQNFRIPPLVEPTFDQQDNYDQRSIHPMRSMSVGSIRYGDQQQQQQQQQQQHYNLMYHPYQRQPSLDIQQNSPNLSIPVYGQIDNIASTIPSPSSPTTPMISPRYQQQHQRHYSTSSISSSSIPRFDPRHYSSESYRPRVSNYQIPQQQQQQQQSQPQQQPEERLTSPNLGRLLNPIQSIDPNPSNPSNPPPSSNTNNSNSNPNQQDFLQTMGYPYNNVRDNQDYMYYQRNNQHPNQQFLFHPSSNTNEPTQPQQQDPIYSNLAHE